MFIISFKINKQFPFLVNKSYFLLIFYQSALKFIIFHFLQKNILYFFSLYTFISFHLTLFWLTSNFLLITLSIHSNFSFSFTKIHFISSINLTFIIFVLLQILLIIYAKTFFLFNVFILLFVSFLYFYIIVAKPLSIT